MNITAAPIAIFNCIEVVVRRGLPQNFLWLPTTKVRVEAAGSCTSQEASKQLKRWQVSAARYGMTCRGTQVAGAEHCKHRMAWDGCCQMERD